MIFVLKMRCCVLGCESRQHRTNIRFFRFPKVNERLCVEYQNLQKDRLIKWIDVLRQEHLSPDNVYDLRVCSQHFIRGFPSDFRQIKDPDWSPSLNLGYGSPKSTHKKVQQRLLRYERLMNREERIKRERVEKELEQARIEKQLEIVTRERLCNQEPSRESDHNDTFICNLQSIDEFQVNASVTKLMTVEEYEEPNTVETRIGQHHECEKRINQLLEELNLRMQEIHSLRTELSECNFTEDTFKGNEKKFIFYSGMKRDAFNTLLQFVEPELSNIKCKGLSNFQKLLLTLMKLKQDTMFQELAYRFRIMPREVTNVFRLVMEILEHAYSNLVNEANPE